MKKKYVAPHTATVKVCGDLLAPNNLKLGSIGQKTQSSEIFKTIETFKIEENLTFDSESQRAAFWDDWSNGAD